MLGAHSLLLGMSLHGPATLHRNPISRRPNLTSGQRRKKAMHGTGCQLPAERTGAMRTPFYTVTPLVIVGGTCNPVAVIRYKIGHVIVKDLVVKSTIQIGVPPRTGQTSYDRTLTMIGGLSYTRPSPLVNHVLRGGLQDIITLTSRFVCVPRTFV
jgi:hypothetical protein